MSPSMKLCAYTSLFVPVVGKGPLKSIKIIGMLKKICCALAISRARPMGTSTLSPSLPSSPSQDQADPRVHRVVQTVASDSVKASCASHASSTSKVHTDDTEPFYAYYFPQLQQVALTIDSYG